MANKIKTPALSLGKNRKIRIFLTFLFLTSVVWLLMALSKNYTSTTKINIVYTNLPSNKLLLKKPINQIKAVINASGYNLIKYKITQPKITLNLLENKKKGSHYYLLPNSQIINLNHNLKGNSTIVKFLTDTIFVELGNNVTKKIPVNSKLKVNFKVGYNFINELKITPDSINISGPKRILDDILEISTDKLELNDVYENVNVQLALKAPMLRNVKISNNSVVIKGLVDKFTEGKFLIPVSVINVPKGIKITTFPKEIEVIYQAGLSNFSKISKSDFVIVFDYLNYQNDTLVRFLRPIIQEKSDIVSSVKIKPSQIEFLIQK